MERLVSHAPQPVRACAAGMAGGAADSRRGLYDERRAGFRWRMHIAPEPRRSRPLRMPRATGQRDRADHDGTWRSGLAADDFLAICAYEPVRTRPRAARRNRLANL